ncbi:MAG: hypothetical protein AB7P49_12935, partial [Bdellovibrionales bacterium]
PNALDPATVSLTLTDRKTGGEIRFSSACRPGTRCDAAGPVEVSGRVTSGVFYHLFKVDPNLLLSQMQKNGMTNATAQISFTPLPYLDPKTGDYPLKPPAGAANLPPY